VDSDRAESEERTFEDTSRVLGTAFALSLLASGKRGMESV
jgi:hypothetical protein